MANTFGYAAGTSATTVDVPAGARLKTVTVVASGSAATVTLAGGPTITVPANASFTDQIVGDVLRGADVVIGGVPASVVRYAVALTLTGASLGAYANVDELSGLTLAASAVLKTTGQAAGVGAASNDVVAMFATVRKA